jgi:multicomponent Na+:H+ antiporter subunit C
MTPLALYTATGAVLFLVGLWGAVARAHLLWKVLAFNIMGSGVFLVLLAAPPRLDPARADPVPQAMVLTGIVVAVAATSVALGIALRVATRTGLPFLEEDRPAGDEP